MNLQEQVSLQLGGVTDAVHATGQKVIDLIKAEQDLYRGVKWMGFR